MQHVETQNFSEDYQGKTDEELLRLAVDADQLIPEAKAALNAELARRRINDPQRLGAFRAMYGLDYDSRNSKEKWVMRIFYWVTAILFVALVCWESVKAR